jgi:hypothetical protein
MEATELEPLLQPGEKVIGTAYLTEDGEIVFSPHADAIGVVLIEPPRIHPGRGPSDAGLRRCFMIGWGSVLSRRSST